MLEFLSPLFPLWGVCEAPGGERHVLSAAFPYRLPEEYYAGRNVARYAVGVDYHAVCGQRLERACALLHAAWPGEEFAWFCDSRAGNAPAAGSPRFLPEVELALRAGIGVRGRHNLLITKDYGSWVFLGEIVTTAPLPVPATRPLPPSPCENCPAPCLSACPTGALGAATFAPAKCLSAITQRKGALRPEEEAQLRRAQTAWGCDLCQEACLANQSACVHPLPEFLGGALAHVTQQTPIAGRAYAWRGEEVLLRNLRVINATPAALADQNLEV